MGGARKRQLCAGTWYLEGRGQLGCKKWKEQMQEFSWLGSDLRDGTQTARANDVAVCTLILPASVTSVPKGGGWIWEE